MESTKKTTCLILEEDYYPGHWISHIVRSNYPSFDIIDVFDSCSQYSTYVKSGRNVDIIISDVDLSDGSILDEFERNKTHTPTIFVSFRNEHKEMAKNFNMIGYILKPVTEADLNMCIDNFLNT